MTLRVLVEHPRVVVIDKPPGVPVIPGRTPGPTVRSELEAQLGRPVWVVHRLDRDTSGALAFALDADTHRELNQAFEQGRVKKRYLALVRGRVERELRLEQGLVKIRGGRVRVTKPGEQGLAAVTVVRPQELLPDATLVEAEPLTGRTHQIRVHLAAAGHPLVVDHQYGDETPLGPLARTPLHAERLTLPLSSGALEVHVPPPADFTEALALLRNVAPGPARS